MLILNTTCIPIIPDKTGWKSIAIRENGEQLVSLKSLDHHKIIVDPKYFNQGLAGAINDCLVRESLAIKLCYAADRLPYGYKFIVWDGFRPLEVQRSLFESYKSEFASQFPEMGVNELVEYTQRFVSLPSADPLRPSPHNTGGSIDLTLCDSRGELLLMGTEFDEFSPEVATRVYEEGEEAGMEWELEAHMAQHNRRLLHNILNSVGFTSYHEEWFHFDFGNQWWAKATNRTAIYGATSNYVPSSML
jgi:D-alanyl-D-alanine dipeptidase